MTTTMKEAIVYAGPRVEIINSPIPTAEPGQVVIKVIFSGSNPKDWKRPEKPGAQPTNQGDDIAGIVHEVGEGVSEFKVGDRVAALHDLNRPGGSYSEYAWAWANTTFPLAPNVSFEGRAIARIHQDQVSLLIIVLRCRRCICSVGAYRPHYGDTIIDYRQGGEAIVAGIKTALNGAPLVHVFAAVSDHGSYESICQVLEPKGKIALILNDNVDKEVLKDVQWSVTMVGDVHSSQIHLNDFGFVFFRYIAKGLKEGWFKAQPHEVLPGGLAAVERGLSQLKDGTVSAKKYMLKISDTPGVGSS
nr:quinone oxidoreductase [Quercus suber]